MSYIGHRCICGHADIVHNRHPKQPADTHCEITRCPCAAQRGSKPELLPTYGIDGQPIEQITQPGEKILGSITTCTCAGCKALYREAACS